MRKILCFPAAALLAALFWLPASGQPVVSDHAAVASAIARQLQEYPESRVQDIYKSFCQDNLGPEHLIPNPDAARNYLHRELQEYRDELDSLCLESPDRLFCPVGDQGNYVRVDLAVILNGMLSEDEYLDAFVRSANQGRKVSRAEWKAKWSEVAAVIRAAFPDIPDAAEDLRKIDSLVAGDNLILHHSQAFGRAYRPHYRIIARNVFDEVILPRCTFSPKLADGKDAHFRLLYWNIQNGMWDGQPDNYDRFVEWVRKQDPDVCVWCEAATIYLDGTDRSMPEKDRYLPAHWDELARRYGHKYVFLGGWRDDYPQVITSRYPIEEVARITGNADTLVSHGAGWARIRVDDKDLNIVTLHTWPQAYGFKVPLVDRERSRAAHEGDHYRRTEMEYICRHTIGTVAPETAATQYWMMMGDFNSRSRVDNWVYGYPEDDTRLLVHDYIRKETPYLDLVHERHPNDFYTTTGGRARIDYVYCTRPLFDCVTSERIISDAYTTPVRNPQKISNFWHPSDHRPILVDFRF